MKVITCFNPVFNHLLQQYKQETEQENTLAPPCSILPHITASGESQVDQPRHEGSFTAEGVPNERFMGRGRAGLGVKKY